MCCSSQLGIRILDHHDILYYKRLYQILLLRLEDLQEQYDASDPIKVILDYKIVNINKDLKLNNINISDSLRNLPISNKEISKTFW